MFGDIIKGLKYNFRGLALGIKTKKLLLLGLIRFVAIIVITLLCASIVLIYHDDILNLIWTRPSSMWILWLWHLLSWLLSFMLVGVSIIISYLISQLLFSVVIMDLMSKITEKMATNDIKEPEWPILKMVLYLIRQEIPRAVIPLFFSLLIAMIGCLTPLGPVFMIVSSMVAAIFLAWDNTDLVPARRLIPFRDRFHSFMKRLPLHLGFGLVFLIPVINIVFLSFAPVGATLYYLDHPLD